MIAHLVMIFGIYDGCNDLRSFGCLLICILVCWGGFSSQLELELLGSDH